MGAAASARLESLVAKFEDELTLDRAKEFVRACDFQWNEYFADFFADSEEEGKVTKKSLVRRVRRRKIKEDEQKKAKEEEHAMLEKRGENIFKHAFEAEGVNQLRSLSESWRSGIVPKDSPRGKLICEEMNKLDADFQQLYKSGDKEAFLDKLFQMNEVITGKFKTFFSARLKMYEDELKCADGRALREIRNLIEILEHAYIESYNGAFKTQIEIGDRIGFDAYCALIQQPDVVKYMGVSIGQSVNQLVVSYKHALGVVSEYQAMMRSIASETGGTFNAAPLKRSFRACEKMSVRNGESRFDAKCVYDIVRGALVYKDMLGVVRGIKAVLASKSFVVERIKDRFSIGNETSGGWRDAMINGMMRSDDNFHRLEIQIHHAALLNVRKRLGGHYIYSKFRSLVEAIEAAGLHVAPAKSNGNIGSASKTMGMSAPAVKKIIADTCQSLPHSTTGNSKSSKIANSAKDEKATQRAVTPCPAVWQGSPSVASEPLFDDTTDKKISMKCPLEATSTAVQKVKKQSDARRIDDRGVQIVGLKGRGVRAASCDRCNGKYFAELSSWCNGSPAESKKWEVFGTDNVWIQENSVRLSDALDGTYVRETVLSLDGRFIYKEPSKMLALYFSTIWKKWVITTYPIPFETGAGFSRATQLHFGPFPSDGMSWEIYQGGQWVSAKGVKISHERMQ
eukprot:g1926.t1